MGRSGLRAAAERTGTLPRTSSLATETVLAQLRSVIVDLLQVTGLDVDAAVAAMPPEQPRS